ncbi:MAG: putative damage-inducible protein DinB [Maribacter sp.]|jgi:uncharacterized damage-inducible protein DinB
MKRSDIQSKEFHSYYSTYINLVPEVEMVQALEKGLDNVIQFLERIPSEKFEYRYQENKWTIKEIIQHIIDTERIFSYRALRIAREDMTPLAGYEQNDYVPPSKANRLSLDALISDYKSVRSATISLYKSLDSKMLENIGNANGNAMSARVVFCILAGHEIHHCNIIRDRYL